MKITLVVKTPFDSYQKGQEIVDQNEVDKILSSHKSKFVLKTECFENEYKFFGFGIPANTCYKESEFVIKNKDKINDEDVSTKKKNKK